MPGGVDRLRDGRRPRASAEPRPDPRSVNSRPAAVQVEAEEVVRVVLTLHLGEALARVAGG